MSFPRLAHRSSPIIVSLVLIIASAYITAIRTDATKAQASDDLLFIQNSTDTVDVVRVLPYQVNDVIYRPQDQRLYITQPGSVGEGGNTISVLHPITGEILSSTFIGSEPGRIALSDDGHSMYVVLDGASSIRRFDAAIGTPGLEFSIGSQPSYGYYLASDISIAPGNPDRIAVARYNSGYTPRGAGVAIFDNGVQLPNTTPGHIAGANFLAFSGSASTLYGGGDNPGLRTMTVDESGVTLPLSSTPFNVERLKFDNGLIFTASGQVIDPSGPALLGAFSVSGTNNIAFVPDSDVGRAFYVSRTGGTITLKAFDIGTFVLMGTLTIPNATSDPVSLVRYGTNGLALRTFDKKLYLIQTSLIPTTDPLPTPSATATITPTATPTPFPAFIREMGLGHTNDMVYRGVSDRLLVSIPSVAGSTGNSIATIDPVTATVERSSFVGSEPNKLALTGDQEHLFVGLDGAGSVCRLDLSVNTPCVRFPLGDFATGFGTVGDIDVRPGSTDTIAVGITGRGAAIFDSGVRRGAIESIHGALGFRNAMELLISNGYSSLNRYGIAPSGLSIIGSLESADSGDFVISNDRLFGLSGRVVDIANAKLYGTFTLGNFAHAVSVDPERNRVYFLTNEFPKSIKAYRLDTFVFVGSIQLPNISVDNQTNLVRWGSSGLAFRGEQGRIFLVQSNLVDPTYFVPSPTPTISPTPTPSPTVVPTFVRPVELPVNDIAISPANQGLYASIASTAGLGIGNSISKIDPVTGQLEWSEFIGSEPSRLAISSDGYTLYAKLDGAGDAVRRFDLATNSPGLQFIGPATQQDMKVMPGAPQTVAFASGLNVGVSVYDNGVRRQIMSNGGAYGIFSIEFLDPNTLYGYDSYTSPGELVRFAVNSSGVTPTSSIGYNWIAGNAQIQHFDGLLYSNGVGRVFNTQSNTAAGTFTLGGHAMAVDLSQNKVFFFTYNNFGNGVLNSYDATTYLPLGSVSLPMVRANPQGFGARLVRWGTNGLALKTRVFGNPIENKLYLIQSELVSPAGIVPTGVQFANANISAFEGSPSIQVTVARSGDLSGPTSVSYVTSDGTAVAGEDYVAANGTLVFQPGETSKTLNITILNDNIYEGPTAETFAIRLTDASGGTVYVISPSIGTISIFDNDPRPTIGGGSRSVREPQNGSNTVTFVPVNLSNPSIETITVNFNTTSGTATSGTDFIPTNGTLTFQPFETTKTIPVTILGDGVNEGSESFSINLSTPINGSISNPTIPIAILEAGFEGDVSPRTAGDGAVNSSDVVQIRRFSTGLDSVEPGTSEFQHVDIAPRSTFGDGVISAADVIQARRYATGLDPLTPEGGPIAPATVPPYPEFFRGLSDYVFGREIRIGDTEIYARFPRSTVVIPIEITAVGDEAAVSFTLEYDAGRFSNPRVELGDAAGKDAVLTVNPNEMGRIAVLVDSAAAWAASKEARRVVIVTFDKAPDGKDDRAMPFGATITKMSISDALGNQLAVHGK